MKKIDRLVIVGFLAPFLVWFLVAVFIFNMQFLWKYIDEIIGKGLELRIILELLFYQALAMVPRALVFGVVIASVMTLGDLAEHYELASMKSAGVSLLRVMRPLIFLVGAISIGSFVFANHIIPVAALQFKTRLYDIRRQKPALDLEPGQFNNDFKNMVIYIGAKDANSKKLKDVRIYDHTKAMGNVSQTNATKGELFFTEDKRFLVIKLNDGQRYEEMQNNFKGSANYFPYMRMSFKEFITSFDMREFDFSTTDKDLFKDHHSLLTLGQLINGIDTIMIRRQERIEEIKINTNNFFHYRRVGVDTKDSTEERALRQYSPSDPFVYLPAKQTNQFIDQIPEGKRHSAYQRAQGFARNVKTQAENVMRSFKSYKEEAAAYENEMHMKFVFAFACILFLFIGAPMGAIIQKGGFGWPIFISFVFFMAFFVLHLTGERLATGLVWPCWMGSWLPILVLFPMGIFLSYKAMNDSRIMNFDFIEGLFKNLVKGFKRKK